MKLTRSSSHRKSSPKYDTRPSVQYPPSPTTHQHPSPTTTTSISSGSSQPLLTPIQPNFPTYNSEIFPHHYHPVQSSSKAQSAGTYPSGESKSLHSRPISRIRNRLSSVGFSNQPSTKLHSHQNKFILPVHQCLSPLPIDDHSRLRNISNLSNNRIRSSTAVNTRLALPSSKSQGNPLYQCVQHSSKSNGSRPFYGVIKHSFKADRGRELSVQAGESVIINAYSDEGWFICKPISRLGGPGLVPITHVQICDMVSGKQLSSEDMYHFLRASGLPQVEEWGQAAAAYKLNSIQLGSFENLSLPPSGVPPEAGTDFDNIEKTDKQDPTSSELVREWQLQQASEEPRFHMSYRVNGPSSSCDEIAPRYGPLIRATAESFHEEGEQLLFLIKVQFASPADSDTWYRTFMVHRNYRDLLAFDASFRRHLKSVSNPNAEKLDLPSLQNQVLGNAKEQQSCSSQLENLKCYLFELSCASLAIRDLREVNDFLAPNEAQLDFEIPAQPVREALDEEAIQDLNENMIPNHGECVHFHLSFDDRPRSPSGPHTSSPVASVPSRSCRSSEPVSDYSNNPSSDHVSSKKSANVSSRVTDNPIKSFYQSDGEFTKIKVYDLRSDAVIVLKVSSKIGLDELINKISDRFHHLLSSTNPSDDLIPRRKIVPKHLVSDASNDLDADFIDCDHSGDELEFALPRISGKLAKFFSDEDLWNWMQTQDKLVMYI